MKKYCIFILFIGICHANSFNNIQEFVKSLKFFQEEEKQTLELYNTTNEKLEGLSEVGFRSHFYGILSHSIQSTCSISKNIGGSWVNQCNSIAHSKSICLDEFKDTISNGKCLVYVFGASVPMKFENILAENGCTVKVFDPLFNGNIKNFHQNVHFKKIGLSHVSGKEGVSDC